MDAVIKELPLALFTTIASVGIGAFVAMFCAIYVNKSMGAGSLKRLDKLTAVPIVFCVVALICAFFHLGDPLHAVNIVNTIGSSPMTNEIVAFCVFRSSLPVMLRSFRVKHASQPSDVLADTRKSNTPVIRRGQ